MRSGAGKLTAFVTYICGVINHSIDIGYRSQMECALHAVRIAQGCTAGFCAINARAWCELTLKVFVKSKLPPILNRQGMNNASAMCPPIGKISLHFLSCRHSRIGDNLLNGCPHRKIFHVLMTTEHLGFYIHYFRVNKLLMILPELIDAN